MSFIIKIISIEEAFRLTTLNNRVLIIDNAKTITNLYVSLINLKIENLKANLINI